MIQETAIYGVRWIFCNEPGHPEPERLNFMTLPRTGTVEAAKQEALKIWEVENGVNSPRSAWSENKTDHADFITILAMTEIK